MKVIIYQNLRDKNKQKNTAPWHLDWHAKIGTTDLASVCREAVCVWGLYQGQPSRRILIKRCIKIRLGIINKCIQIHKKILFFNRPHASDDISNQWKTVQTIQFNCPLFRYQATVPLEITLINKYEYQNQYWTLSVCTFYYRSLRNWIVHM